MTRSPGRLIGRIADEVIHATYVPTCAACNRRGQWVCTHCAATLEPILNPGCLRCGRVDAHACECAYLPPEVERMRSVYPFAGWVRDAIHRFKFEGEWARSTMLADQIAHIADQLQDADGIVPVPIHPSRRRIRGFNQTELLAKRISATYGIPVMQILERSEDRGSQVGRSGHDRWLAVQGVFACAHPASARSRRLIVLDDVITTGATVSSCAQELARAGASSVRGISIARG